MVTSLTGSGVSITPDSASSFSTLVTASGSVTIPSNAQYVRIFAQAAGGGGGSGRRGAAGSDRFGGGGGGGGGVSDQTFLVSSLPSRTLTVSINGAGVGGAAVTANDTNGNAGTAGGTLSVTCSGTSLIYCSGGNGGNAGLAASGTGGGAGNGTFNGGGGGNSAVSGNGSAGTNVWATSGPGGGAGGISAADVPRDGGAGQIGGRAYSGLNTSQPGGTVAGTKDGTDAPATISFYPGGGGGGGAASITGVAGNGGSGIRGGGGGGGGASLNGNNSGAGGNGGGGYVQVWFF